jgi:hypothetical protein
MASLIGKDSTCVVDGGIYAGESGVVVGSTVSHVPHFDVLVCHKLVMSSMRVEIDQQFSEFTLKLGAARFQSWCECTSSSSYTFDASSGTYVICAQQGSRSLSFTICLAAHSIMVRPMRSVACTHSLSDQELFPHCCLDQLCMHRFICVLIALTVDVATNA